MLDPQPLAGVLLVAATAAVLHQIARALVIVVASLVAIGTRTPARRTTALRVLGLLLHKQEP